MSGILATNPRPPPRHSYPRNRKPEMVPRGQFLRNSVAMDHNALINGLKKMTIKEKPYPKDANSFESMGLSPEILKGIYGVGYEKPAFCQQKIILPIINGRDVICQAQSGMGKTAAYTIGILQKIDLSQKDVQALILTPTRELADQVKKEFTSLGHYVKGLNVVTCTGGPKLKRDIRHLEKNPQIIIGTCGRIADLLERQILNPSNIQTFVLDEADKMITDPSFRSDLQYIIYKISGNAQIVLASATMPELILKKAKKELLRNPLQVLIPNEDLTLQGIRQYFMKLDTHEQKISVVADIFPSMGSKKGMIFCNTRKQAEELNRDLQAATKDSRIAGIVGTLDNYTRKSTLENFRTGAVNYLVSSDLLGRGIDVQQLQVVVNFELPSRKEEYIHRVGRAGRYGRKGVAITFILNNSTDEAKLKDIQEFYATVIEELPEQIVKVFHI